MKRKIAFAAAACTLAVPAIAFGQTFAGVYEGHIKGTPETLVKLKFSGATNPDGTTETRVNTFAVRNLTVECDDGVIETLDHAKLKGNLAVSDQDTFRVRDDNGKTRFAIDGEIKTNKAFGNFRLAGKIKDEDGSTRICDTGRLPWVARP